MTPRLTPVAQFNPDHIPMERHLFSPNGCTHGRDTLGCASIVSKARDGEQ